MFKLEIETDNAAFDDPVGGIDGAAKQAEVARILRGLAADLERYADHRGRLRDGNGNTVGRWQFTAE